MRNLFRRGMRSIAKSRLAWDEQKEKIKRYAAKKYGVMITFLKIIAVILLLLAMVTVLLSVRNLGTLGKHMANDAKATEALKKEFKESKGVITKHSVFHDFLGGKR